MTTIAWMILWIPFLVSAAIFFFLLWRPKLAGGFATLGMFVTSALTLVLVWKARAAGISAFSLESSLIWIPLGSSVIEFGILLNGLSLLMLLIVTGIGSLIFLYSMAYMEGEEGYSRYFASLSFFAFSMLGIVLSNNLIQTFIFWELVGLSSYLLIGFHLERTAAADAGKKAFLTTRVGDVGMLIGILLLFHALSGQGMGTFNFRELPSLIHHPALPPSLLTAVSLLIFLGVAGKSAQVPLHVWLPDAMEGPAPVSALIHAATMVAAGVFLLARLSFLFEASPQALQVIAWVGGLTAFLPATIAVVQNDIKKILAYSTLSQLGYMVLAIGLGSVYAGMFHLMTHAFYKALLFLAAGSLIHAMHTQDIWEMSRHSGLFKKMPVTSVTFWIGTLALMGIPPLSGFYSKEEVLTAASGGPAVLFGLALFTVFLTAFYMGRLCTVVFLRKLEKEDNHFEGTSPKMWLPLVALAVLSAAGGFLPAGKFLGHGGGRENLAPGPEWLKAASIGIAAAGFLIALFTYYKIYRPVAEKGEKGTGNHFGPMPVPFSLILQRKYFFDDLYDALIKYVQGNIAKGSDAFERIVVVGLGANGTAFLARAAGKVLSKLQTGGVQFYASVFALGVTGLMFWMILGV